MGEFTVETFVARSEHPISAGFTPDVSAGIFVLLGVICFSRLSGIFFFFSSVWIGGFFFG